MARFSIRRRLRGLSHAWQGIVVLVATQHSAWIHLVATVVVIVAGVFLRVGPGDWCWLAAAIAGVWCAEAFNTALEFLADEVTEERRERIRRAKDLGAAGVLCAAIGAAAIGVIVFTPHVRRVVENW